MTASVIESVSSGFTSRAAGPAISGIDERSEVMTGVCKAKASSMGRPNPS